jgi:hypothetical protein
MEDIIKDYLQPDFIEEVIKLGASDIINEEIDKGVLFCKELRPGDSFSFYNLPLYVLTRLIKPKIVIETGCQNGASTQAILYGMFRNNKGKLITIDSGKNSTDGSHKLTIGEPGERVFKVLKDRWTLIKDYTFNVLYDVFDEIYKDDQVDLFFHDSDHSSDCMNFELGLAAEYEVPYISMHDHYEQWNSKILKDYTQIIANNRPNVHELNGVYHNVLRLWRKNQ